MTIMVALWGSVNKVPATQARRLIGNHLATTGHEGKTSTPSLETGKNQGGGTNKQKHGVEKDERGEEDK